MSRPNFTERLVAGMASTPVVNDEPAPGFDDVESKSDDVSDALAFERRVAEEARRRTAEAFPLAPAGSIHEGIRDRVRKELRSRR